MSFNSLSQCTVDQWRWTRLAAHVGYLGNSYGQHHAAFDA